ncbi:uncharacterized protein [Ptychodera flava]|uniref:uncharacterized protein n=1 Tax=Ptychodera flava TaxID=63121 RepID=UPI003969D487
MLNIAKEADAMVSIGPSMYEYFQNAYRAISDRSIPHIELLPKVGECFQKQRIRLQESTPQRIILSYGEIHDQGDITSDYGKIASTLGKVASAQRQLRGRPLKWNILDIPSEFTDMTKKSIIELTDSDIEVAKLKPTADISQLLTHLQQSHLCVTGLCHSDFGFYGLEAIAAGLPTYVNRDSQLGSFITKYLESYKDLFLASREQEWHDKLTGAITHTKIAMKWAYKLKTAYFECAEIDQSYARFSALFTEEKGPSEDLAVTIELNTQLLKQRLKELSEQMEVMSRQELSDQSAVAAIAQDIQDVSDTLKRCQQRFKRKTDNMVDKDNETLKKVCSGSDCGVNQAKITKGSLGMFLNFLSILGLYRFKSSVHTGRFAKLYEPSLRVFWQPICFTRSRPNELFMSPLRQRHAVSWTLTPVRNI